MVERVTFGVALEAVEVAFNVEADIVVDRFIVGVAVGVDGFVVSALTDRLTIGVCDFAGVPAADARESDGCCTVVVVMVVVVVVVLGRFAGVGARSGATTAFARFFVAVNLATLASTRGASFAVVFEFRLPMSLLESSPFVVVAATVDEPLTVLAGTELVLTTPRPRKFESSAISAAARCAVCIKAVF